MLIDKGIPNNFRVITNLCYQEQDFNFLISFFSTFLSGRAKAIRQSLKLNHAFDNYVYAGGVVINMLLYGDRVHEINIHRCTLRSLVGDQRPWLTPVNKRSDRT